MNEGRNLGFQRKIFIVPFCAGIMIALYGLLRLSRSSSPFESTRILKIVGAVAIAVLSWILGSRQRTTGLNFERKMFIIPFCLGITIAVYALLTLHRGPSLDPLLSLLTLAGGATIAVGSWLLSSRQRVQRGRRSLERFIEAVAFKNDPQANASRPDSSPASRQRPGADSYVVAVMAITIVVYAVLWAFFAPLYTSVDDVGLFNPIYTYLHTGTMAIPTYHYFHSMVVHPPTQYLVLAWLMKAGVPLQYVGSVPPFLLILLTVTLLICSRFSSEVKLALLFGFFAGILFFLWGGYSPSSFGLRPDLHLAFALFAGLIGLESGRLQSWDPLRLGLGAFLLTYASGIHYPASLAWTGILIYLVWLTRDLHWLKQERGWSGALRPVFALLVGGCAFGIPYLLLFVIPHWHEILGQVRALNAMGGVLASLVEHMRVYRSEYSRFPPGQFARILYAPLRVGLPTVLVSTAILLPVKQTRGIALASLPYLLFLLFFVQRKIDYRYLLLEVMLYVCGLSVLLALACRMALRKLWPQGRWLLIPFLGLFLGGALISGLVRDGAGEIQFKPRLDTMTIARAAGRQIVGPGALVGLRVGRFYVDGGDIFYLSEPDLGGALDFNLKEYFEKFDAVAEDHHWSHVASNDKHESLSSWYAEGLLSVRGFFSSHVGVEYLLLNAHPPARLEGYGLGLDGRISHFSEQTGGNWEYIAAVCDPRRFDRLNLVTQFHSSYLLPQRGSIQKQLEWLVIESDVYQRARSKIADQCAIRDEIAMTMDLQDANQLLLTVKDDAPIHFCNYLSEALAIRYGPEEVIATASDGWPVELRFLRGPYQGEKISLAGESAKTMLRSDMSPQQGWSTNIYDNIGRVKLVKPGFQNKDASLEFYAGDSRDHLATQYLEIPPETSWVFFSIWAKPEQPDDSLNFSLQDEHYQYLAQAGIVERRPDGWILFAGWFSAPKGKIRAVIQQPAGNSLLLDKALILSIQTALGGQPVVETSLKKTSPSSRNQP